MTDHNPDRFRDILAFVLVGSFVSMIPLLIFKSLATENKEIITYMVGQLSGMALTAIGLYFTKNAGQEVVDAKRAETTAKAFDAITATAQATATGQPADVILKPGETAQAEDTQ